MQLRNLSIIVFCFLVISSFTVVFLDVESRASGAEIYVDSLYHEYPGGKSDGSAEHPYTSINEAINLADEGDTIYVFGGLYDEHIVIDKKLKLWGSIENGPSIIDCTEVFLRHTVEINADYVEFQNFDIRDSDGDASPIGSLLCINSNNAAIQSNNFTNFSSWGIYLSPGSNGNVISENKIDYVENGIYVSSSSTNDIYNNFIGNCSEKGIYIESSQNNRIYGNKINNSFYGIYAKSCNNINISNNTISTSSYHGVYLDNINGGVIKSNFISSDAQDALYIKSDDITIQNNTFDNNRRAISLFGDNCEIINNRISNSSSSGVYTATQSNNNLIYHNYFHNNNPSAQENGNNHWYFMDQGNYWDDYNYVDRNLDGIGDRYYTYNGVMDIYPLGYFLKPPKKPTNPKPKDTETDTNLKITVEVYVEDPDSDLLTVYFYRADTNTLIEGPHQNPVRNVASKSRVSYSFTQPFNATYAWYVVVNDSLLENRSDVWFFLTRAAPPDNIPPVADAGGPYSAEAFEPLQLDASNSKDPDGTIAFYRWNFGDGSSQILEENPVHIYRTSGQYTATLTIIDDSGSIDTDITTVQILPTTNQEPTAVMNIPLNGYAGSVITFSSSGSIDPEGDDLTYLWDFGDGNTSKSANPTHIYSNAGTYLVTLKVSDWQYDDIITGSITISRKPKEETPGFEILSLLLVVLLLVIVQKKKNK
ncbi:MAG: hypothetical protein BV457_03105 [Thermoplasmata archaeon M9B1D]|nr:MAG: hypothetical protein BV457_03105 [Thermoplasmata archaeon M9B1D]PNX49965.1 MAG: hypothetical protein BV456_08310 [Thermoplasmata archaeon M8B2D]